MTPNELRAEAAGIDTEEGTDCTTRACLLRAAADKIEWLSSENADLFNWRGRVCDALQVMQAISASRAAEIIASLHEEAQHLRGSIRFLERAIARMDKAAMSPEMRAADTEAVGAPVPAYSVNYDEEAAVARVVAAFASRDAEIRQLRDEMVAASNMADKFGNERDEARKAARILWAAKVMLFNPIERWPWLKESEG